jgi:hypothetical protein
VSNRREYQPMIDGTVLVRFAKCTNSRCSSPTEFNIEFARSGNVCKSVRCSSCNVAYMINGKCENGRVSLEIIRADF